MRKTGCGFREERGPWKARQLAAVGLVDFRPFRYVRVSQIPTPRWTAYDQKRYGIKMSDEVPMTVTDSAYTSADLVFPGKVIP